MLDRLVAFSSLAAVLVLVPGPAVVLVMKNVALRGRRTAVRVALGVLCGDFVWVTASVAGVTAVLVASRPAFEALRFAGAAYLVYLGLRLLLHRREDDARVAPPAASGPDVAARRAFREGALCELSNPKTLLVFTSVVPQFLPASANGLDAALFGTVFAVLGFFSLLLYVMALGTTRRLARRTGLGDVLLRVSGAVLVAFGVGLAVERPD